MRRTLLSLLAVVFLLALPAAGSPPRGIAGAVYVATNGADNAVLAYDRFADGRLDPSPRIFPTDGAGTGAGLGNQGGLVLNDDQSLLFVVNAASDEITVFAIEDDGLDWLGNTPSGGQRPISLTQYGPWLYVLNAGGAVGGQDEIAGFEIGDDGSLSPIPGSIQPLSAASTGPAQIGFSSDGRVLVVSEKATNLLTTFVVEDGVASGPFPQASAGATPFGFAFGKRGQLFVSEAFGGGADASAVSSYHVGSDGLLVVIDPSVPTTETAACWLAISNDGRFAYTTNTGSSSTTGYSIAFDGELELLDAGGVSGSTGAGPIDMDFSTDGRNLYTLNAGGDSLSAFRRVGGKGALANVQLVGGLPDGANGLAAR